MDSGMGGELLADYLEQELPILDIIRVIDWRHAEALTKSRHTARKAAEMALRPYINHVDLIILANHLLSFTSLDYFRRKYPHQKFIGLTPCHPQTFKPCPTLILTTSAVAHTLTFRRFVYQLRRPTTVLSLDDWPGLIDDGELSTDILRTTLADYLTGPGIPAEIILLNAHFSDIRLSLRQLYTYDTKIYDSFPSCYNQVCRILRIRGGVKKSK